MFGIANQMLAVIALAIVTVCIVNEGRGRYAWVTVIPMTVVMTTTTCASVVKLGMLQTTWGTQMAKSTPDKTILFNTGLQVVLILAMLFCTGLIVISGVVRIMGNGRRERLTVELAR